MSTGYVKDGEYVKTAHKSASIGPRFEPYFENRRIDGTLNSRVQRTTVFKNIPCGKYLVQHFIWQSRTGDTGFGHYDYSRFNGAYICPGFFLLNWSAKGGAPSLIEVEPLEEGQTHRDVTCVTDISAVTDGEEYIIVRVA